MKHWPISLMMLLSASATAALAFVDWYSVRIPGGEIGVSAVEAHAHLWALPALGGLMALGAIACADDRPSGRGRRRVAVFATVAAALAAVVWALVAVAWPAVPLEVVVPDRAAVRLAPDLVRVDRLPAAFLAAAAAAIAASGALLRRLEDLL